MGEKAKEALKLQWCRDQRGTRSAHYELIWEIPAYTLAILCEKCAEKYLEWL